MVYSRGLINICKYSCFLLIVFGLPNTTASDYGSSPTMFIKMNQTDKQMYIEQHYEEMVSNLEGYFTTIINKGDLYILEYFINKLKNRNTPYQKDLNHAIKQKIKKMESIYNKLKYKDTIEMQTVAPAFEWAESKYNVMLNIFFSGQLNSISCPEIDNPKFVIKKDKQKIRFEGRCLLEGHQIHYVLDLNLYDRVSNVESTKIERGVYKVVLKKDNQSEWDRLLKGGERLPSNSFKMY